MFYKLGSNVSEYFPGISTTNSRKLTYGIPRPRLYHFKCNTTLTYVLCKHYKKKEISQNYSSLALFWVANYHGKMITNMSKKIDIYHKRIVVIEIVEWNEGNV